MPKIDIENLPIATGARYPAIYAAPCVDRQRKRLGEAVGLTQFGVNLLTLKPGVWSALRHWHTHEDEFVYVLSGEVVLVTDEGEQTLNAGDAAGFKAGVQNGHHFQNRSSGDVVLLEIGARIDADGAGFPDVDLVALPDRYKGKGGYARKDGTPY